MPTSLSVRIALLSQGWRPGRDVWEKLALPKNREPFAEARRILREYGKLRFGASTDYVAFDPGAAEELAGDIDAYEAQIERRLYPIGFLEHQDREFLLVDEPGIIYVMTDELRPMASSFETALEYLISPGRRSHIIQNDLQASGLSGKKWKISDETWSRLDRSTRN